MSERRVTKGSQIAAGVRDAIPIKTTSVDGETILTLKLSLLIRYATLFVIGITAAVTFMGRIDTLETTDQALWSAITVTDSLIRKDFNRLLEALRTQTETETEALRVQLETETAMMVIARETDIREISTALETVNASLMAEIDVNYEVSNDAVASTRSLIVSINSTTYAELKLLIDNVQNSLDIQAGALAQRIESVENQVQDQSRSLFSRR